MDFHFQFRPHSDQRHRVYAVREEMRMRTSVYGSAIDAYIVTTWDEHLNEDVSDHDKRTQYISGFTGKIAHVVVCVQCEYFYFFQFGTLYAI